MSIPVGVIWRIPDWRVATAAAFVQCLAGLAVPASAMGQVSQPERPVVLTRLVPEAQFRRHDGKLLFLAAREIIQHGQAGRIVYDGRGPTDAVWVGGVYRREVEGGRWRFVMYAWHPGRGMHTAVAVGRPTQALRECLCALGILSCSEL